MIRFEWEDGTATEILPPTSGGEAILWEYGALCGYAAFIAIAAPTHAARQQVEMTARDAVRTYIAKWHPIWYGAP